MFLDIFNISESIHPELKYHLWMDQDILRPNKTIDLLNITDLYKEIKELVCVFVQLKKIHGIN